jgi:hypothetical protein
MAAVTPAIDKHWTVSQQLGERFLKFRIRSALVHEKAVLA